MLDPVEEQKFAELRQKCRELGVPSPPEVLIGLQVHNKNGVLVFSDKQRGHSWTRNFYNMMYGALTSAKGDSSGLFGAGYMSSKRCNDGEVASLSSESACPCSNSYISSARASNGGFMNSNIGTDYGIVVGTGSTAFDIEQYQLATLIAHGNSAGQLYYQISSTQVCSYAAKTWTTTHSRIINNNSGGLITVAETGIYFSGRVYHGSGGIMIERNVLSPTVDVGDTAQLTVTYEISMDFSAID